MSLQIQSTISQSPFHHLTHSHTSLSSTFSHSLSSLLFKSHAHGFPNSTHQWTTTSPVIKCSFISKVHNYNTVDFENRPVLKWKAIYKRVSMAETHSDKGSAGVLNQWENEGNRLTKFELFRVVKELRKFKRYKPALEVFDWMRSRTERFTLTTSETAIQLDLVAKVHGISGAENYFLKQPDTSKDKRLYGALLNAYARAKLREKAESLMAEMKEKGFCMHALPFNVMMTFYMSLKEYDKVDSIISEMMEKNIQRDLYTYNIWLASVGYQGFAEKMEEVVEQMNMDTNINPNWSTFTTMATMYIKMEQLEKAEECLRMAESKLTRRDRIPYHYLISLYAGTGNKQEVQRIWNDYKMVFSFIPNLGYHFTISAFTKLGDIEEAEKVYGEWLSVKTTFDTRISNLLLVWYVRNGFLDKAEAIFNEIYEFGGKPISSTWEILAEAHIIQERSLDAVTCLKEAVVAAGSKYWKPQPLNVSGLLKLCEKKGDMASKEILLGVMRQVGCFEDEAYMSFLPKSMRGPTRKESPIAEGITDESEVEEEEDDVAEELLSQLQGG